MDNPAVWMAVFSALLSLIVAVVSGIYSFRNQAELEYLRRKLEEETKEKDALRDYQYEARKRLYEECEPILFCLAEVCENALGRIYGVIRSVRNGNLRPDGKGWLESDSEYYFLSTFYRLLAPIAVIKLLRQTLTSVDLSVDARIKAIYETSRLLFRSFRDDHEFAQLDPRLDYAPTDPDWRQKAKAQPGVYLRQGIVWGRVDLVVDALTPEDAKGFPRLMSYGQFEAAYFDDNSNMRRDCHWATLPLLGFHPQSKPVFWRMLVAQATLYKTLLHAHASSADSPGAIVLPNFDRDKLDWRRDPAEATDEVAIDGPLRIARKYLENHIHRGADYSG